ncbi:MAG TPA: SIR2 family protein [Pyrinomonadaceae bacterium]|nr:SIR2 family protein [Pyrinomonadaceae bacterium]
MASKRAAFFFGSGISRDSGAPMVDQLTDAALGGSWESHTDSRFYPSSSRSTGEAERAQEFLRILNKHLTPHLQERDNRVANYEDLFGATVQIVWDETGDIVNPLLRESSASIRNATEHLWREQRDHIVDNSFASLVERAGDLVQWMVFHELAKATEPVGLDVISGVAGAVDEVDIFSVNHDLLIERELRRTRKAFADGFGESWGDVLRFNWSWNQPNTKVRLYKLHGSLDWYLFRSQSVDQFGKVKGDPEHCRDENGNRLSLLQPQPRFLTGTVVKEQSYGTTVTGECFAELRRRLAMHKTLICSGYGWGDKGINVRINQWLRDQTENKLVILHNGDVDHLKTKGFWFFRWDDYVQAGKLSLVPRWLRECTVEDLEPFFS